jgi:uncharacterized membrane protein
MTPLELESPLLLALLIAVPAALLVLRYTLVDAPRTQLALSAAVRGCILLLLVLALAGALWVRHSTDVAIVVVADLSDSVPEDAAEQLQERLAGLEQRVANPERAGLIAFSAEAEVKTPMQHHPEFPEQLDPSEDGSETAVEQALLLARQMMPADAVNRVLLVSDGNETRGRAMEAAQRLAAHGIELHAAAYGSEEREEVLLEDLRVPAEVQKGESFAMEAVAHATKPGPADITLYRDGFKIQEKTIDLEEGRNTLVFEEHNPGDGLVKYMLRVRAESDFFADNNVTEGVVFAQGEPKVLLLEGDERAARFLARSLQADGMQVDVREGRGLPGSLEELAAFDAVILSDVPATDLDVARMELVRSYVEDLGGGLVMIGGEESFGLGGYYRTAVEDVLPLRMRSERKKDTPSMAMMLVIDKSGSMGGQKIELAKEAAIATVELLSSRDYVGVVVFDGQAMWAVDVQNAANAAGIARTIESIQAGGGTSMYPALDEAFRAMARTPAALKHVVVLTDGQSQPGDFRGMVNRMAGQAMTVSTVAVGQGADTALLQDMARWGGGRYYFTGDPFDIPQIFTKETMTASKSSLVEEPFLARQMTPHPALEGVDWEASPFLFGYCVTLPKTTAQVPMLTERGDPLFAAWQYGLGKAAAFTSDAKSRWAADWLDWPGYSTFWTQLVRYVQRTSQSRGTETAILLEGESGRIVVDNVDEEGNFLNDLTATAHLIRPDLSLTPVEFAQTAPGRYEAEFELKETGSYLFKVRQTAIDPETGEEELVADFTRGASLSYLPEYRRLGTNEDYLRALAAATGGTFEPTLDELLTVEAEEAVKVRSRIWPWLLLAALLLFVADVALRRLDLAGYGFAGTPRRYG